MRHSLCRCARIFVWKAMPSMTAMMSTILLAEPRSAPIVCTTSATTVPADRADP